MTLFDVVFTKLVFSSGNYFGILNFILLYCYFVYLTRINFFVVVFFLAFLHVLYVSHKLNLLMLSSRLS